MRAWAGLRQALRLKREPANAHDESCRACVVQPSTNSVCFLRRDVNKGFAEVTRDKVNRGAGRIRPRDPMYLPSLYSPKPY